MARKGYYAVLFHSRSRNDYHTVSVRHILVDSEEKANELLQQYNDGEKTEDAFAALAVANSTDPGSASNGGLYSNIYKGEMVPSFEDWCFDPRAPERRHGHRRVQQRLSRDVLRRDQSPALLVLQG